MFTLLTLATFLSFCAGIISIIYPLRFLKIRTRGQGALLALLSLVAIVIISMTMAPPSRTASSPTQDLKQAHTDVQKPVKAIAPSEPSIDMPDAERLLVIAVQDGRTAYAKGQNDLAKGAARPARARQICAALTPGYISGWVGTVARLSSNSDGKGVLGISVGPDIQLSTWNNSLSDLAHQTLIKGGSSLMAKAASLRVGQKVQFSGRLFPSETDCIAEQSITLGGSIREPVFVMKFDDVSPLN
jgi:hypothetical protein